MSIRASVFSAPTNVMALMHPFVTPAYNEVPGIPIGIDARSREIVNFDPWLLKDAGLINSTWGLFIGPKNVGKSAFLKILSFRLMLLSAGYTSMRTAINDYKPEGKDSEYSAFSRACNSIVFRIADMQVNPFDSRLFMSDENKPYELGLLGTAEMLCEFKKGSDLTGYENPALRAAISAMLRYDERYWSPNLLFKLLRSLAEDEVINYYDDLDNRLLGQLKARSVHADQSNGLERIQQRVTAGDNYSMQRIIEAGSEVANYLGDILTGSFGHMFGDKHSMYDLQTQDVVTKDWRGVDPDAEKLMRALDISIKTFAFENNRLDLLPHIEDDDEKHKPMDNIGYARANSFQSEIARSAHTVNLSATHELNSLRKGAVGSELYNLGNRIINNNGFFLIGRQPNKPDVLDELRDRCRLTDADRDMLPTLPNRHFLLCLGETEPARLIRTFATEVELPMLGTNSAVDRMNDRPDVFSEEDLALYAQANGVALAGEKSLAGEMTSA